ncbi:AraC family transcriptional regulator [Paenibacillus radicis (ex Xue et al. 2023)]|uniref:AraC family transcriptional regulator n=1 Tax=Paenibacillus radicis (ex Xue et al. 2023) TaxID=2972489 RepID=A0ABT1YTE6_9BACL|nr:AraC family transcriptional regulator [Paenibacillus radicis (ex Xue et al. 2023)]MCR8636461.1 AraC family transcriptional regulator [Paenibacillus radicis (ex Xue et al. 2023)]
MDTFTELTADRFPLIRDIGRNRTDNLYTHPDRILDYHVFLYVAEGSMQVIEEGTSYVVKEKEYLFLNKNQHHWGLPETPAETSWYWIHFNTLSDDRKDYNAYTPLPELEYYYPDHYEYRVALPKYGVAPIGTEQQFLSMIKEMQEPSIHKMTRISLNVFQFFLDLNAAAKDGPAGAAHRLTERVMAILAANLEQPFDAAHLQAQLNMNYSYISSSFKKSTGQTIVEAHTKLRLSKAIELMRSSSLNIAEISEQLGYQNPFYFSRVFKKVFGEPPSSFMRQFYRL